MKFIYQLFYVLITVLSIFTHQQIAKSTDNTSPSQQNLHLAKVYFKQSEIYSKKGKYQEAIQDLDRAISILLIATVYLGSSAIHRIKNQL